jgi:nucleoside-diphosphate-sugar epimerase
MRILIAGGAGYVGSALTPRLIERGYSVDVVDLLWFGNHLPPAANLIRQDVLALSPQALAGYDQVLFLAGLSNDPMAEFSPADNFVQNAACPAYLAYLSKKAGVKRYIYGGSCSVYGYTVNQVYDEAAPVTCQYPYGISKLQGEFASLQLHDRDFSVICFRKGTISGYSPRMRLDLIVNAMFRSALRDQVITVNNPSIWRPILALQDAVTAYLRAIEAPPEISGIFNVASGNYTVGEVADCVQESLQQCLGLRPKIQIKRLEDYRNYKVSIDKARDVLSFHPRHDVASVVRELFDHRQHFSDFDNIAYYNIRVFGALARKQPKGVAA